MKAVILAGGHGTRLSEETGLRPKPMVEIGPRPILWHIMKCYDHYGIKDFVILLGYKGYYIKEYFANYYLHKSDVTIHTSDSRMDIHDNKSEDWRITLIDTGLDTMTGGRIKRAQKYIGNETFMLTYGDGISNINFDDLIKFHKSHAKTVTMTSVQPDGRFGALQIEDNQKVASFLEKPKGDGSWINGGFFVCEPSVFDYIKDGDSTVFERGPLETLAQNGELYAYRFEGFWKCMDTLRDKTQFCELWESGEAPWRVWK